MLMQPLKDKSKICKLYGVIWISMAVLWVKKAKINAQQQFYAWLYLKQ